MSDSNGTVDWEHHDNASVVPQPFKRQAPRGESVSVRVTPVSRAAAILMIILGVFTLIAGLSTGIEVNTIAGIAIIILGLGMYQLLYKFTRKVEREIDAGPS